MENINTFEEFVLNEADKTVKSPFEKDKEKWYDVIARDKKRWAPYKTEILKCISKTATSLQQSELAGIIGAIISLEENEPKGIRALDKQMDNIRDNKYKDEFKYQFGGKGCSSEKVSQTSSLFCSLKQALTYGD